MIVERSCLYFGFKNANTQITAKIKEYRITGTKDSDII